MYKRVLVFKFSDKLAERLNSMDCNQIIIGTLTIEAAGFILDLVSRKLRKVGMVAF